MTVPRMPGTVEATLLNALGCLPGSVVQDATGLSQSTLYAISRPGSRSGLHLSTAAGLDAALRVAGYQPAFIPWAIEKRDEIVHRLGGPKPHHPIDPLHRLTDLICAIGNIADELRASVDATGLGGEHIVQHEAERVRAAIAETRVALDKLERDVQHHTKPDTAGYPRAVAG